VIAPSESHGPERDRAASAQGCQALTSPNSSLDTEAFMNQADPQTTSVRIPDGAILLVVDRNPFLRRALRRTLELEGTSVVEAGDGGQALRAIEADEAQLIDVVLTSLLLPVVSAPELIEVLLQRRPRLPVVAMSALGELPADLPTVPLLHKPFDHEELVRTVAPLALWSQTMRRLTMAEPR
jgi:CheY-like chemotaxis protein